MDEHLILDHSFEISWCLWFVKTFSLKIDINILQSIIDSDDQISILIALDIINNQNGYKRKINFSALQTKLTSDNLYSKYWLICYEIERKKWRNITLIDNNEFFKILDFYNVYFYDETLQVKESFILNPNPFDDFLWDLDIENNEEGEDEDEEGDEDY